MRQLASYGKILTLGSAFTENALIGEVSIQEKVDGSMFAFGISEFGEVLVRSKGAPINPEAPDKMFIKAVQYAQSLKDKLPQNTIFYCEYLQKPKHNTLTYDRTPTNHLVLFDVLADTKWLSRVELESWGAKLSIDVIPELWSGDLSSYLREKNDKGFSSPGDFLKGLTEKTTSYLGGEIVEGVVIKNFTQLVEFAGRVQPLHTKYVREAFKERHSVDWKNRTVKGGTVAYIQSFKSEARWEKAIQYLRDSGQLTNSPKDIGPLIQRIQEDVSAEEEANIKNELLKLFIEDIHRASIAGFPQFYKDKLLQNA